MIRLVCLVIGYVFGLFQTSFIYGKMHGIDIRDYGSGNAGTTNMLRTLGKKAGAITFLGDALKCVFAVLFVRVLFGSRYPEIIPLLGIYTAAGVVLGHNFPVYMNFRGGKGIAVSAGMFLALDWRFAAIALITFAVVLTATHYVSLGSMIIYAGFVAELIWFGQSGQIQMEQIQLNEMYAVGVVMMILAFFMHRANIARLISGNERKTYVFKKNN